MTCAGSIPAVGFKKRIFNGDSALLNVTNIIELIPNGYTKPFKAECSDGELYVIKPKNDITGNHKIEFNELIAYRYARLLDLPTPNANIVNLPEELLQQNNDMVELSVVSGPCFASQYHTGMTNPTPNIFASCKNQDDLPCIFLFDQLLLNDDRGTNSGNLLFDRKSKKILAIDHSNIFKNASIWTAEELLSYQKVPPLTVNTDGKNYLYMNKYVNGNSPFNKITRKLDSITPSEISRLFINIPLEWDINDAEISACESFLKFQTEHYKDILKEIRPSFPKWKGAI